MTEIRSLIVDDEPDQRLMIRNLLARHADVKIVGDCVNGYEAIEAIREHAPDLIFLDVHMPEVDGFSVLDEIEEELRPLDVVLPDQFYDRTKARISTFFGNGIVAHVSFGDPVCHVLSDVIGAAGSDSGVPIKRGGTYLCMEGPQFSTKAESNTYRSWGMDLIGMTNLQEAKLAREAEICYSTMALVTDYDCWHPDHDSVTVADIIKNLTMNSESAQKIIRAAVKRLPVERTCKCSSSLQHAILTDLKKAPPETRTKLELLLRKYL